MFRREIVQGGRGRAFINNQMVPVAFLRKLGKHWVDIHGQSDQQSLFSRDSQLRFLDLCSPITGIPVSEVEGALSPRSSERCEQILRLKQSERERLRTIDQLSFQME